MNIIRGISSIPDGLVRPVVTIGNFDGVHVGHQQLLRRVIKNAEDISGTSVVITFEPHPASILRPEKAQRRLTSFHEKLELFQSLGIKVIICIDFTEEFARWSADEFISTVLCEKIGARVILVGRNYNFGRDRKGNIDLLRERGKTLGFEADVVEAVEEDGLRVSSSRIRDHLNKGEVDRAAKLLGRYYTIEGLVTPGHHRGVELGYPTANIYTIDETLPKDGIYAVRVVHGNDTIDGVCYIGTQPTFSGTMAAVEVHLFDFEGTLYHEHLKILFIKMIRGEHKFSDQESLILQIREDVDNSKRVLAMTHSNDNL